MAASHLSLALLDLSMVMPTSRFARPLALALLALVLWIPLFLIGRLGPFDFWWWICINIGLLVSLSFLLDKSYLSFLRQDLRSGLPKKILWGLLSAIVLYFVFYLGNSISRVLFPFAAEGIAQVYSFKQGSPVRIFLLIAFIVGPGEELFWRGFLQRHFQDFFGPKTGFLLSVALYTLIHIGSGNPMLLLAALVCGLFWSALYAIIKSPLVVMISHTLWDILVFLVWPF